MQPIRTKPVKWQVEDKALWVELHGGKFYVESVKGELFKHFYGYFRFIDIEDEIPGSDWEIAKFDDMQEACMAGLKEY
jgi:hypothetical protein